MVEKKNLTDGTSEAEQKVADICVVPNDDFTLPGSATQEQCALEQRLSPEHLSELRASAISDEVIDASGVYTALCVDDLPGPLKWVGSYEGALPALVFPLVEAGTGATWQVKPQPGSVTLPGKRRPKYVCPKKGSGCPVPSLVEWRGVSDKTKQVFLVEGTKQALAVLSATGEDTAVYGLTGISSWQGGNSGPNKAFQLVEDLPVYIFADADAAKNRSVYDGAFGLGELCKQWGAEKVRFVLFPGGSRQGIDDVLGGIDDPAKREKCLRRWVKQAGDKPSSKRPVKGATGYTAPSTRGATQGAGKPRVSTELPDGEIWDAVDNAVYEKFSGSRLFRMDSKLVCLVCRDGRKQLVPVDSALAVDLAAQAIDVVRSTQKGSKIKALSKTDADTVFNSARIVRYPRIEGIVETPVLTPSGKVLCTPGYDEETGLFLDLSDDLDGFHVPNRPTQNEVVAAVNILEECFRDFPFDTEADLTRAIGMVLTLLVRPSCETSPLYVVSANTPGTGKGLLLSAVSMLARGHSAYVQKMPRLDDEMQKVITSALLSGRTMIVFDETDDGIDSTSLASMLTSEFYEGRILGESRHISVKNAACVFAAGNNVAVKKDLGRRTVMVELKTPLEHPESRKGFLHPDLLEWVKGNRRSLLEAAFTLVRAWVVAGKPAPTPGQPVGSFETWYRVVGGVLEFAGRRDLMDGVQKQRVAHNESVERDVAHLHWVFENFDEPFLAYDVECKISNTPGYVPLPSNIPSLAEVTTQRLGTFYSKLQDRKLDGLTVNHVGFKQHTKLFEVVCDGNDPDDPDDGGTPVPPAPDSSPDGATTVVFDLETDSADDLHTAEDPSFVRLAAFSVGGSEVVTTTDIEGELLPVLRSAGTLVGHNIVHYDLPALKRLYGFELAPEQDVHDTLVLARLADPPKKKEKKYSLDEVALRFGVEGKLSVGGQSVLKKLEKQYGGFGNIPVDNEEFVQYAAQDVCAARAVYEKVLPKAIEVVGEDYVLYEHQVEAVLAGSAAIGVRVDKALAEHMVSEEESTKRSIRARLVDTVGIPDKGKSPWSSDDGKQALQSYVEKFGASLPLTEKGSISTSKTVFVDIKQQHGHIPELVELCDKMCELLESSSPAATVLKHLKADGRLHPSIQPDQATGRLSTTKPGMTVFGSRDDRLVAQRALILPDSSDEVLIGFDLSQIDARCMAAGSGDERYAALFEPGKDAHTEMALRVFGDADRRSDAKALAHATNYGMGARGFAKKAGIEESEAHRILVRMQQEFPALERFKQYLRNAAERTGHITTGYGRRVLVNRGKAYTQAPAAYGQGTARDVFLKGVLALPDDVQRMIRIFVHDEIVLSIPKDRVGDVKRTVIEAFGSVQLPVVGSVEVPVLADSSPAGSNWAECKG